MDVFVTIRKLIAEFVGATFNFSWPPSTNIIDGSEGFFRSLVYRKGSGEILIIHRFSPSLVATSAPANPPTLDSAALVPVVDLDIVWLGGTFPGFEKRL